MTTLGDIVGYMLSLEDSEEEIKNLEEDIDRLRDKIGKIEITITEGRNKIGEIKNEIADFKYGIKSFVEDVSKYIVESFAEKILCQRECSRVSTRENYFGPALIYRKYNLVQLKLSKYGVDLRAFKNIKLHVGYGLDTRFTMDLYSEEIRIFDVMNLTPISLGSMGAHGIKLRRYDSLYHEIIKAVQEKFTFIRARYTPIDIFGPYYAVEEKTLQAVREELLDWPPPDHLIHPYMAIVTKFSDPFTYPRIEEANDPQILKNIKSFIRFITQLDRRIRVLIRQF